MIASLPTPYEARRQARANAFANRRAGLGGLAGLEDAMGFDQWGPNGGLRYNYESNPVIDQWVRERQASFNPFVPKFPDWGPGGHWDQQNQFGQRRALMSQSQAPDRMKLDLLAQLMSPSGAFGKLLGNLGNMFGGSGGGGMFPGVNGFGMQGMASVNSPQAFSLGPLLQQMSR